MHTYTPHALKYSHSSHSEAVLHTYTLTHWVSSGYITGGMTSLGQWYIVYLETDWLYVTHTHTHTHIYASTLTQILVYTHTLTQPHNKALTVTLPCTHTASPLPRTGIVLQ